MAITFVDSYWSGHIVNGSNIPMTIPASAQAGDVMIAYCHQSENTAAGVWDDDGGGGNGWTRLAYNRTTGGRDIESAVYYKVHSGSETNPTFTWDVTLTTEAMSGSMVVYRGVDTASAPIIAHLNGLDDGNPSNPTVSPVSDNATVVVFHSQTHDDVTAPAQPTGFNFRVNGWVDDVADHMNHYVADIHNIPIGSYTPPDWQHTVANTTPEYHTYSLVLEELPAIVVEPTDTIIQYGTAGYNLTGSGFGATQGTGKLELWSDLNGTIKTLQTVTAWSDTSITYTAVQGSLANNTNVYLVVTNDSAEESSPIKGKIAAGMTPYSAIIFNESPDHWWKFDNDNYADLINGNALTVGLSHGECRFAASCTGGDAHIRGVGYYENLGTISVVDRAFVSSTGNLDETSLHTALDSYANKDDWKAADVSVDLQPVLDAITGLHNLSLLDIEGSTVLAKEATLSAIVSSIANIPTTDSVADLTPVMDAIAGLNDVTPAEVRAAFDVAEFKDKNTEAEIHAWLDSYTGKDSWKADVGALSTQVSVDNVKALLDATKLLIDNISVDVDALDENNVNSIYAKLIDVNANIQAVLDQGDNIPQATYDLTLGKIV